MIDVSTPSSPFEVGFIYTPESAYAVAVSGSFAYVVGDYDGLRVIDVSTPASPFELSFVDTQGYAFAAAVSVSGSYAYVADGVAGVEIFDLSSCLGYEAPRQPRCRRVGRRVTPRR